jgi:hypothetical protein
LSAKHPDGVEPTCQGRKALRPYVKGISKTEVNQAKNDDSRMVFAKNYEA